MRLPSGAHWIADAAVTCAENATRLSTCHRQQLHLRVVLVATLGKKCQRSAVGRPPRARLSAFAAGELFRVLTVDPDAPDVPDAFVLTPIRGVLHVGHGEAVR